MSLGLNLAIAAGAMLAFGLGADLAVEAHIRPEMRCWYPGSGRPAPTEHCRCCLAFNEHEEWCDGGK